MTAAKIPDDKWDDCIINEHYAYELTIKDTKTGGM